MDPARELCCEYEIHTQNGAKSPGAGNGLQ